MSSNTCNSYNFLLLYYIEDFHFFLKLKSTWLQVLFHCFALGPGGRVHKDSAGAGDAVDRHKFAVSEPRAASSRHPCSSLPCLHHQTLGSRQLQCVNHPF